MICHVNMSNHLIVQRVILVPAAIQLRSESSDDNSSVGLATFNPFKSGSGQTQGHPTSFDNRREACRILLEDFLDAGELKFDQQLRGIQLRFSKECIRGAAWCDSELYVRPF